ncbi:Lrp/AsnC family transcriptional regulator [Nubsella zeaxanthinifaciens]|uniref:Lrp/AsnC family transcriptional regulator n=1 Tax=Nubsella zeaxanthinifaciens TaxID=392412 RepID=UPI000DE396E0|nr:Lrp/AsnC family transcriptional regulator [Nubsella zeaxanthinifaciens]
MLPPYLDNEQDFNLIKYLQEDGRISFTDLAKKLNVSISTVRNRYNNLVNDNVINVYARINPDKIGLNAYSRILISVRPKSMIQQVIDKLYTFPEISFLASVSGDFDIEVNVMCRDNNHLLEVLHNKINQIEGVYNSKTNFYLKVYKFSTPNLDYIREELLK